MSGCKLLHAETIAALRCLKFVGCSFKGFVQVSCLICPQRKKSQMARSRERGGQGQSLRLPKPFLETDHEDIA